MNKNILILAILSFTFAACQKESSETQPQNNVNRPQNTAATPNVSPGALPINSSANLPTATPDKSKIKTFNGRGKVTKINLELGSVELDHEEIKGLMPKMQMEFYVKPTVEIKDLKLGDQVNFVIEDNAGAEIITSIKKIN
jgi:Cu/Ag efflux protein CusF